MIEISSFRERIATQLCEAPMVICSLVCLLIFMCVQYIYYKFILILLSYSFVPALTSLCARVLCHINSDADVYQMIR